MDYSKLSDNTLKALKEGKPLDYSKLSDDELVELKKITKSSGPTVVESEAPSQLESFGRGAAQGASFGFADEATGLLESLLTNKSYEQARDESRAAYKAAEAENPMISLAGNLVGGFAVPVPGMGSAKTLGELAKQGAKYGAIGALGTTETEITNPDIIKDAAAGALIGGTAGGAIGAIGKGLSKAKESGSKILSQTDFGRGRTYGKQGVDFFGEENYNKLFKDLTDRTKMLPEAIQDLMDKYASQKSQLINQFGKDTKVDDVIKFAEENLTPGMTSGITAQANKVMEPIENLKKMYTKSVPTKEAPLSMQQMPTTTEAPAPVVNEVRRILGELGPDQEITDSRIRGVANELYGMMAQKVKSMNKYIPEMDEKITKLNQVQDLLNLDSTRAKDPLRQSIDLLPMLQKLESSTSASDVSKLRFGEAEKLLAEVDPSTTEMMKKLQEAADKYDLARAINRPFVHSSNELELGRRIGARIGDKVGRLEQKIAGSPSAKVANKIFNAKPEALSELATRLEAKGSKFAPVVRKLATEDTSKRNALMFTLMQQPAFREAIESEKEDGE